MGDSVEILKGVIALIQEFELETAELPKPLDSGRFEGDDDGAEIPKWSAQPIDDCGGGMIASLALRVRPGATGRPNRRWGRCLRS